ncbi:MAG: beta-galactosidase [Halobacteriaceae archaeon]
MQTGVCYFPEHWSRDQWAEDVSRMVDAGIEYVRMGEFAWTRFEPEPGTYDFEWLETAVDLVADAGMQAVLCTPTATPPKWLVDEHPDIRQEDQDGTVRQFGSRRHYCFNSPVYRRESRRIVSALAEHFAGHPGVVGWQTDNEFGCHDTLRCYCDDCASAFRDWLRDTYEDVDALNEAWGTAFWSQTYRSFGEIDPPRRTPANHHPAHLLDYHRFTSDRVASYNRLHADILREADDDWFLTHNFMGDYGALDARDVSDDLDFASWDSYPTLHAQTGGDTDPAIDTESEEIQRAGDPDVTALNHALYRCAGDGPFWVMEHQAGDIRAFPYSAEPADGMLRVWAHASVAHGAETVSYFRWRRCRYGQEQYWGALCDRDGRADRGLQSATQVAEEFEALPDLGPVEADVALLHDYDSLWAIEAEPHSPEFDYWSHLRTYFRACRRHGATVDVVGPDADFGDYEAVVAPSLYVLPSGLAERLADYVADGGDLVVGARSGYADAADTLHDEPSPGPLADVVGATVEQHESLAPGVETTVAYDGADYDFRVWGEWLDAEAGSALATHRSGPGAGAPAAVRNDHGAGTATYVGVWPGTRLADALVSDLLGPALPRDEPLPDGVRLAHRGGYTWVLNHGAAPVRVETDAAILLGDAHVSGHDVTVVEAGPDAVDVDVVAE